MKGYCNLCRDSREMPMADLIQHLRLMHPLEWDGGPELWPDGQVAIYDDTLTPGDSSGEA